MLTPDIKWKEPYVSAGLNRKLAGVLPSGAYWGYEVDAPGGMMVRVWPGSDPDYALSVAVVDRDGYSITVRQSGEDTISLDGKAGSTVYIVLDAAYAPNEDTTASLQAVTTVQDYHVCLAKVVIPSGATAITSDMITFDERQLGNPAVVAMSYAATLMSVMAATTAARTSLANLAAWAKTQGYDPDTQY